VRHVPKESIINRAVDLAGKDLNRVLGELETEFKDVKPIGNRFKPEEIMYAVDTLSQEDMGALVAEFGEDQINKLLYQVHKWKTDGRRHMK